MPDDDDDVNMAPALPASLPSPSRSLRDMTPVASVSTTSSNGIANIGGSILNGVRLGARADHARSSSQFDQYRTGVVFCADMMLHANPIDEDHPEKPLRIYKIYKKLKENRLFERMKRIPIREVTEDEVKLVHDQGIWDGVWNSACKLTAIDLVH